jgi:FkbM family methyltransferase
MELKKNIKYKIDNLRYNYGNYFIPEDSRNGIAIDIGCNNGCFIDYYKNFFNKIYAYEANFFLVEKLKEKFANNSNIEVNHYAVSNESNKIFKLVKHKESEDNGSFAILKDNTESQWDKSEVICEAKSINIEDIIDHCGGKIDFMKIDCETSEYELLLNKDLSNVKYIAIELHNQLGIEKYIELHNFLSKTHNCNEKCNFIEMQNQEFLFYNKKII